MCTLQKKISANILPGSKKVSIDNGSHYFYVKFWLNKKKRLIKRNLILIRRWFSSFSYSFFFFSLLVFKLLILMHLNKSINNKKKITWKKRSIIFLHKYFFMNIFFYCFCSFFHCNLHKQHNYFETIHMYIWKRDIYVVAVASLYHF